MKLLTIQPDLRLGIQTEAGVVDVAAAGLAEVPTTMDAVLAGGEVALDALRELAANPPEAALLPTDSVQPGPCVPYPGKIICVGLNYARHAAESGAATPTSPVLFSKFNNTIAAPGDPVPLPDAAVEYDYEVELVAVIGKQTRDVSVEDALDHVVGYATGNDLSARDLQMRTSQWLLGKTLDKFMPIGPWLVTADEVGDPQALNLKCWLNGELRQNSNTADMIFSVAEVVSYASQYMTLEAGDIITTGTPEGVILGMNPKVWMKPGDEVTVEIEKLGKMSNTMV
ncbi:MAG: 5-carboxymethyl-2-hydroxymuconate isomerase [Anaerolineaceae bacterium]|nr:5-carboxymethyl-2-hydroxymuconate isomerase [Anaerolineaceae bacterium]